MEPKATFKNQRIKLHRFKKKLNFMEKTQHGMRFAPYKCTILIRCGLERIKVCCGSTQKHSTTENYLMKKICTRTVRYECSGAGRQRWICLDVPSSKWSGSALPDCFPDLYIIYFQNTACTSI
mgnify:CR=1 FL=1